MCWALRRARVAWRKCSHRPDSEAFGGPRKRLSISSWKRARDKPADRPAPVLYAVFVGLAHATTVRVGYAVARADVEQTGTSIRTAITTGTAIGLLILAITNGWSSAIPWSFVDSADPAANEVAVTASGLLMLLGIVNAAQGPASPATAELRAFKDTRVPMGHYLVGYWLVGLPAGCIAAFPLGYETEGVWFGLAAGMITTAVLVNMRLSRYNGSPATVASPA